MIDTNADQLEKRKRKKTPSRNILNFGLTILYSKYSFSFRYDEKNLIYAKKLQAIISYPGIFRN